jgi:hypothetical protein
MRFLIFIIFSLITHSSFAQKDQLPNTFNIAEIDAEFKGAGAIRHYKDRDKRHYFIGLFDWNVNKKTIVVQTDSSFNVIKRTTREKLLLGDTQNDYDFVEELNESIGFYSGGTKFFINKSTLIIFETPFFTFPDKENIACWIGNGTDKYLVTYYSKKNKDSLFVYSIDTNAQVHRKAIDCTPLKIENFKDHFNGVTSLGSAASLQKRVSPFINLFYNWGAYYRNSSELDVASSKEKAYLDDNTIIFLSDIKKKKPHVDIVKIDLNSSKATFQTAYIDTDIDKSNVKEKNPLASGRFANTPPTYTEPDFNITSNIFDNKLFIGQANKNQFILEIKDFENLKTLKKYTFKLKDSISFKNSPLAQIEKTNKTGFFFKRKVTDSLTILTDNELLLEKMSNESFGIKIVEFEDSYELMIGAVEDVWETSGSPMMMGANGMMMGGGTTSTPVGYITYCFKSVLDSKTLEHKPDVKVKIENEYQRFVNRAKMYKDLDMTVAFGDESYSYFAYYDKKKKKFVITGDRLSK